MSKESKMMVATESFITKMLDGGEVLVREGTSFFWSDHELVKRFPQNFKVSVEHERPEVESATRAPGEKRGRGRPRSNTRG